MAVNVPRLSIGRKTSNIDIETTIYFDEDKWLILDAKKVNYRNIALLSLIPPSNSKHLNGVNEAAELDENKWIKTDLH